VDDAVASCSARMQDELASQRVALSLSLDRERAELNGLRDSLDRERRALEGALTDAALAKEVAGDARAEADRLRRDLAVTREALDRERDAHAAVLQELGTTTQGAQGRVEEAEGAAAALRRDLAAEAVKREQAVAERTCVGGGRSQGWGQAGGRQGAMLPACGGGGGQAIWHAFVSVCCVHVCVCVCVCISMLLYLCASVSVCICIVLAHASVCVCMWMC
jgi:hypothetical protein